MNKAFQRACEDYGLDYAQAQQMERFRDLLAERSTQFNLTAVRDIPGIERRHVLEALALGRVLHQLGILDLNRPRWLDIGSGAGLPGLPLKIAHPWLEITLLEASSKKCAFMRQAIAFLGLAEASVAEGRCESLAHDPAHRETYDVVIARAVAPLPVLIEYALPFMKLGGRLVAQKGSATDREISEAGPALRRLNGVVERVSDFTPPDGHHQRIVIIQKDGTAPPDLPRRPGIPSKRPLG